VLDGSLVYTFILYDIIIHNGKESNKMCLAVANPDRYSELAGGYTVLSNYPSAIAEIRTTTHRLCSGSMLNIIVV
jgi:hypothetical protein